jgi:catalase
MASKKNSGSKNGADKKNADLERNTTNPDGEFLTTNHGLRINDNQNSLKAHERGPSLLEDFILREKITHFDHERIPERAVHARGAAAHGFFQVYESQKDITAAKFLQEPSRKTPVFVRFSTVAGSRGSTDLARDVRGFAVKFYTDEGNYDLVGNNIPVFFIQDAIKFPDLIHAVKPEPNNEIPQAASAHDTFWDFISLTPESTHMIMWAMSDRAIPRSLRTMEGFGVHTFRLINEKGKGVFVKFHWKPVLGIHSVVWDEAQKISGKDSDFHRRDLFANIEAGNFPEWELGLQIVPEADEHKYDFDLLDPTKLIPEELVPVKIVGKMTLNRNPDNFFAETEQVAFHPGHLVAGIDFTNDPLLQGRLFSYTDTQLTRLGGPNFHEIPINRPVAPVHNNQRDGHMRQTVNIGTAHDPNTTGGGCPFQAGKIDGGFVSFMEKMEGSKVRARSKSFFDHFSQATLFYNSQSDWEKAHITKALQFELGKVKNPAIRERMVGILSYVDKALSKAVADALGIKTPVQIEKPINRNIPADGNVKDFEPITKKQSVEKSDALSIEFTPLNKDKNIKTRKIAVLLADGFAAADVDALNATLKKNGATSCIIAPHLGAIKSDSTKSIDAQERILGTASVLFDAIVIPGGAKSVQALLKEPACVEFINDAFKHCKTICAVGDGVKLVEKSDAIKADDNDAGLILASEGTFAEVSKEFVASVAMHRHWAREAKLGG